MADLSATTKIKTLMITACWTEFHIKYLDSEKNFTPVQILFISPNSNETQNLD